MLHFYDVSSLSLQSSYLPIQAFCIYVCSSSAVQELPYLSIFSALVYLILDFWRQHLVVEEAMMDEICCSFLVQEDRVYWLKSCRQEQGFEYQTCLWERLWFSEGLFVVSMIRFYLQMINVSFEFEYETLYMTLTIIFVKLIIHLIVNVNYDIYFNINSPLKQTSNTQYNTVYFDS